MNYIGVSEMDKLGRIKVPKDLRHYLGWEGSDQIGIQFNQSDRSLTIRKMGRYCLLCHATTELATFTSLLDFTDKTLCKSCIEAISNADYLPL